MIRLITIDFVLVAIKPLAAGAQRGARKPSKQTYAQSLEELLYNNDNNENHDNHSNTNIEHTSYYYIIRISIMSMLLFLTVRKPYSVLLRPVRLLRVWISEGLTQTNS